MKTKYSIACREQGRGRASVDRFSDLVKAKQYIQDRWQGAEYMDGKDGFHTDYSTYELNGFTLSDIGLIGWDSESCCRTFEFKLDATIRGDKSDKHRIVVVHDSEGETHHCRATEAYIKQEPERGQLAGVWTDAEYLERFDKSYVPESVDDSPCQTVAELHSSHSEPSTWCPICSKSQPIEDCPF